ncbi:uncharacterized protein [Ptychodera flava]|uniref:uncharacterized protein n=1 Tax=Ptychodera flava TaxID=63121 RepID=UPI003969FA1D
METLTHLFKVLTLLVLSRLSFQQEAVDKTDNCFDSQYVCASENQCAHTFVLPRSDGETCASVKTTVRDMGRLVAENEEFKQTLHEIQGELIRLKAALGHGQTAKDGVCPASSGSRNRVVGCVEVCEGDQDCPGRKKCCQIGCDVICVDPAPDVPAEPEYEVCWSGDMCNQCDRRWVGGINGLDVCCPHCRQSGLRIIARNCTCAKDRSPDDDGEDGDDDNYDSPIKDGVCPAGSGSSRTSVIDCMQMCEGDQDCPGRKKCCQIGCDVICVDPAPDVPAEPEYEVCWSGDMCNQCDRRWVGGINGLDVCCPHCRPSGLRIIARNCTCAKDRSPDDDGEGGDDDNYDSPIVTEDSWTRRTFLYDDKYNSCHGDQYVKLSGYDVGRYVGVILCSSERYKIFLSDDLDGVFLNVADSNGHGQDHCEFLGGTEESSNIDNDFWDSPSTYGYYRSNWGESPRLAAIGGGTGSTWTGKYYGKWIECGLTIP